MANNEEKDIYIKVKIKDSNIPERIDELFNNSKSIFENKGEKIMENNEIKNQESKEQESKNKESKGTSKQIITRRAIVAVACLVILLGGGNIYASTKGYGNVFSMVKEWVTPSKETKQALSEANITISDENIEIAKGINLQVNKLEIKDNQAKLHLKIDKSKTTLNITPFTFKVLENSINELCNYTSKKTENIYTEELVLNNYREDINVLELQVLRNDGVVIIKLEIDIQQQKVEVVEKFEDENEKEQSTNKMSKENLVGEWRYTGAKKSGKEVHLEEIFGSSVRYGTGSLTFEANGKFTNYMPGATSSEFTGNENGTYTISGNTINLVYENKTKETLTYENGKIKYEYNGYTLILEKTKNSNNQDNTNSTENNIKISQIEGEWKYTSAEQSGEKLELREIFGSSVRYGTGSLTFEANGKFTNYMPGATSSEFTGNENGAYTISGNTINLVYENKTKETLTYENGKIEYPYSGYNLILEKSKGDTEVQIMADITYQSNNEHKKFYDFYKKQWQTQEENQYFIAIDKENVLYIVDSDCEIVKKLDAKIQVENEEIDFAFVSPDKNTLNIVIYNSAKNENSVYVVNLKTYECKEDVYHDGE